MITIFSCINQGRNHYSVVSIRKALSLLKRHHKIDIKRRWLFQCFRDLLSEGYITRKARYKRRPGGLIGQIPSMLSFTLKGAKYLVSRRVSGAIALLKSILSFVTGKDQRWPKAEDVKLPPGEWRGFEDRNEVMKLLNNVARTI